MKTIKKLSLVLVLALTFSGCDAIGDLLTIKITDVKMTKDVEITVNAPLAANGASVLATGKSFTQSAKVQISDSEELEEYLSNIKDIILDSITCKVYGVENGDVQSLKLTINPLNYVKEINTVVIDEVINIPFTDAEFKEIANALLDSKELEFVLEGVVNKTPLTFNISVTIDADFVVKVLKDKE